MTVFRPRNSVQKPVALSSFNTLRAGFLLHELKWRRATGSWAGELVTIAELASKTAADSFGQNIVRCVRRICERWLIQGV